MKNRNLNNSDNWKTPQSLYDELDKEFNFDFDPCPLNHDINKWNGLSIKWGKSNFVNPPYSRELKEAFVKKAIEESKNGVCVCVFSLLALPQNFFTNIFYLMLVILDLSKGELNLRAIIQKENLLKINVVCMIQ